MRHILIILSFLLLFSSTIISCRKSTDNTTSTETWTKQLGSFLSDSGDSVTTDSSGNIYVTGNTEGDLDGNTSSGGKDIFLVKYNSDGVKQ